MIFKALVFNCVSIILITLHDKQFKPMKKIAFITIMALMAYSTTVAQENTFKHWQARVEASSYNTIDWGLEFGINYFPIQYVGVGVGLCTAGDFTSTGTSFTKNGMLYETNDLHDGVWFRAGIQLCSPYLWQSSDKEMRLSVKADVGITLPMPTNNNVKYKELPNSGGTYVNIQEQSVKNHGARACYFHVKPAVALDIDRWQVWVGYTFSDLDVYSGSRNVVIEGQKLDLPSRQYMHGGTIGIGYRF